MRWLLAFVFVCGVSVFAEDYLTEGVDSGRTGWLKNEKVFTTSNVGSMKLLWKIKVTARHGRCTTLCTRHRLRRHDGPGRARTRDLSPASRMSVCAIDVATGR